MGYFLHKFGIQINALQEAEADGQDLNSSNEQPTDYEADDNNANNPEPSSEDQNNNEIQEDEAQPAEEPTIDNGEEPPMDYNDADASSDSEADDGSQQPPTEDNGKEEQPANDIKQQEEEIYNNANMTTDQLDIKHKELKSQFLAMYDLTSSIIDRIGDANINEENIAVIEFISENLSRLRTMLTDYIESVYAGKSYIENAITFNRFLATLNGINKMLEQIEKKEDK